MGKNVGFFLYCGEKQSFSKETHKQNQCIVGFVFDMSMEYICMYVYIGNSIEEKHMWMYICTKKKKIMIEEMFVYMYRKVFSLN